MEIDQQKFVPDEKTQKEREELKRMTNEMSSEVDSYEQEAIKSNGLVLSLNSMKQQEQSLGG